MLPIIALHECFVCTNLMYSQWTISNYYPYRKSKSPDKSLDYLEVYIWTHHKTIIFLQHRICRCSSMTELDILNLHHSVPKSSKSVYNGRGGGHILKSPSWFFFFKLSPWSRKTIMKSLPAHWLLHEPSSIFTYHRSVNPVLESPEGSVYDSQLCTSGISSKPIAEAWLVLSKTWHWLQFRHFYFHVARLRRSMFLYHLVI